MATITIRVDGMHCEACSRRIQDKLSTLEGVRSVTADHEADEATVEFVAGQEDEAAVRRALEAMNYSVVETSSE